MAAVQRPLLAIAESLIDVARQLSEQATIDADRAAAPRERAQPGASVAARFLQQRHLRRRFLPETLFHEPAWEILLVLYAAKNDAPMSLKELSFRVDAPFTTTQRWVEHMVRSDLVLRTEAQDDRRRVELTLTSACMAALDGYFAALATM